MKTAITPELGTDFLMNELQHSENKEDFVLSLWMFWSESVTVSAREYQKVLSSRPINNWFLTELKKEDDEFFSLTSRYPEISGQDKDLLYIKCIYKLFSIFPMALLKAAKKRETRPQKTKVPGRRIEFSIINQN